MDVQQFTQDPAVLRLINGLKEDRIDKVEFSDVIDDEGYQYVDLVMEGGGVLGIALVGYTYALEEMGIRFLRIGGTSAGSINALLMAALNIPKEPKSEEAVRLLADLPLNKFVDGDEDAKDFVKVMRRKGVFSIPGKIWEGAQVLDNLWRDLGLNPGNAFQDWLSETLADAGIHSARDLGQRMRTLPDGLKKRHDPGPVFEEDDFRLALVAADVSTETKAVFPKMAPLYWEDPDGVDPALYVRASMSIPYFFRPLKIARKDMPSWDTRKGDWEKWAGYKAGLPKECLFIDGGIASNFPIDLFHKPERVPAAPTFGAKLGLDERRTEIRDPQDLTWAIFNSARHCLDYDFITRNPDYNNLLTYINTEDYDWLNFDMDGNEKVKLFREGVEAAAGFLRAFDWKGYKEIREQTAAVSETARRLKETAAEARSSVQSAR